MSAFELFSDRLAPYGNALLNWQNIPAKEILSYAWSYRRSAATLTEFLQQRRIGAVDNGALPILFLYRHSFELYLKAVVYNAALRTIDRAELSNALPRLWREHSLLQLAELSSPILTGDHPLTASGVLWSRVSALAEAIDAVDPGSYSFRYPVSTSGKASLPSHFMTNVHAFSNAVESVLDDLSQLCMSIEEECAESSPQWKLSFRSPKGSAPRGHDMK